MGKVNVIIVDATGNKEQKVGLPDDIKCGIIMVKLVEKIKLPSVGPDGNPISYKFIHKVTGRQLLEAQTLGEAGIKDGDVLRLQPEITAGAVCPQCGSAERDGNAFCGRCGAALPAPQPTYTPAQPNYEATTPTPASTGNIMQKLILIIGIIGVGLFLFGNMFIEMFEMFDVDYDSFIYSFLYSCIDAGQGCFMFDIVLYMFNRLKK